jgi:ribosomal protein S18 acetylase RimI-like enzyme
MLNISISGASEEKWQDYKKIRLDALKNEPSVFGSSFEEENEFTEELWKQRSLSALIAYSNSKPIGLLVYIISNRIKTKHVATIYSVYVNKGYRGQGVGKRLLKEALDNIKRNLGVIKVDLAVNPEQISAVKLYENIGFKAVGCLSKEVYVDNKFYDQLLMELIF